jgi:hypothetical protein
MSWLLTLSLLQPLSLLPSTLRNVVLPLPGGPSSSVQRPCHDTCTTRIQKGQSVTKLPLTDTGVCEVLHAAVSAVLSTTFHFKMFGQIHLLCWLI